MKVDRLKLMLEEKKQARDDFERRAEANLNFRSGEIAALEELIKEAEGEDEKIVNPHPRLDGLAPDAG